MQEQKNYRVSIWTIDIWRPTQNRWDLMATATNEFYAEDICTALRAQNNEVRLARDGSPVRYYPPWAEKNGK